MDEVTAVKEIEYTPLSLLGKETLRELARNCVPVKLIVKRPQEKDSYVPGGVCRHLVQHPKQCATGACDATDNPKIEMIVMGMSVVNARGEENLRRLDELALKL